MNSPIRSSQSTMQTLYNSDSYVVVHLHQVPQPAPLASDGAMPPPALARHGFEIVDKRAGKQVYLDGLWAELFQQHISAWQVKIPSQEEVENTLAGYAALAQTPVGIH